MSRQNRERHMTAEEDLDRLPDPCDISAATAAVLVSVGTGGGPGTVYSCTACTVTFDETEGASPSISCSGDTIYALNVGTANPSSGTKVIACDVGGRYAFRWDS